MTDKNSSVNSGVHGSTGYEFQKHCALYVFLEKYPDIKDTKYFICLEHHEDFLFCYLTSEDLVRRIESYQAKKSSTDWGMSKELIDIIHKMSLVGLGLLADPIEKTACYDHALSFSSNKNIKLSNKKTGKAAKKTHVGPSNNEVRYISLDKEISATIKAEIDQISASDASIAGQLEKLTFCYLDLPQHHHTQVQVLIGKFSEIFGAAVSDHFAAVNTLLRLFRNVENVLNQGNVVKLMDVSKRVNSEQIDDAINIITTQVKAYETWRGKADDIADKLGINLMERKAFVHSFKNSLDLFKDKTQVEHQKILSFVKNSVEAFSRHTSEVSCIEELFDDFQQKNFSQLGLLNLKAAIFAAYIEVRETHK